MAAVARVFDEAIARRHRLDAVAEEPARIPHFLREASAVLKAVACRIDERMPAPHTHVIVHPVPIGEPHVVWCRRKQDNVWRTWVSDPSSTR